MSALGRDHGHHHVGADEAQPRRRPIRRSHDLNWMPLIFTFMLATFRPACVYWPGNNSLSVIQQSVIMRSTGAKIELIDNIKGGFRKEKP